MAKMISRKKKNCAIGYSCRWSCIARTRQCRVSLSGQLKGFAAFLQKFAQKMTRRAIKSVAQRVDQVRGQGKAKGRSTPN